MSRVSNCLEVLHRVLRWSARHRSAVQVWLSSVGGAVVLSMGFLPDRESSVPSMTILK